ncbi:MAG: hypothetical protein NZL93_07140, partial [Chthoniobacterales bacterium]|nr:hypothetical protein [Chthoniobacterales bacterium]
EALLQKVRALAETVRATGKPAHTEPLNSYDRYLVHNEFVNDPELISISPKDQARLKRITIRRRTSNDPPPASAVTQDLDEQS